MARGHSFKSLLNVVTQKQLFKAYEKVYSPRGVKIIKGDLHLPNGSVLFCCVKIAHHWRPSKKMQNWLREKEALCS
jgi:hypothetical protein